MAILIKDVELSDKYPSKLFLDKHCEYIYSYGKKKDEYEYCITEYLRLSGIYWGLTALDLMGHIHKLEKDSVLDFLKSCQQKCGGFSSSIGHDPHVLYTLSAVQILTMYDALDTIDVEKTIEYVKSLQQEDGSFVGDKWGEVDTRFTFCAVATLALLKRLDEIDVQKAVEFVLKCMNFDGGFGCRPGSETHSGQIYCCLGILSITHQLHHVNSDLLGWWLCERQLPSGGLNGRPEKLPDVCYSWWVLASLKIIGRLHWIDKDKLVRFILASQDEETGGFSDRPGDMELDPKMDENLNFSNSNTYTNSSPHSSTSSPYTFGILGPEYHSQMRICLLTVMIAISIIGNCIMYIHISQHRRRNHRIQLLFINLALADFLVTCFTMTSQLVWECMGREWIAGAAFCPIFKVLQTFTMVCSNYLIVTIALDRHFAIVYPLKRSPNTRFYLVAAWLVSFLPSLPNAYIFQVYTTSTGKVICVAKFYTSSLSLQVRQYFMAFVFLSVFILPIFIVVGLYARILYVIWTRTHAFPGHMASAESISSNSTSKEPTGIHSCYPRAKIKTLKMTLVVVVTFLATSLPYLIQEMIIAFGDPLNLNENVVAMAGIFSASNSTINPYVYLLFNAKAFAAKRIANSLCSCCLLSQRKNESRIEQNYNV